MPEPNVQSRAPQPLIIAILAIIIVFNLFVPGESNTLSLAASQVVVFGFAGLYLLFIRERRGMSAWLWPLVFFFLALLISQFASLHGYDSMRSGLQLVCFVLTGWLVADIGLKKSTRNGLLLLFIAAGVILSIYGLTQLVTFFSQRVSPEILTQVLPVPADFVDRFYDARRIFASFRLPTTFAAFLAMVVPLSIGMALHYRKRLILSVPLGCASILMLVTMLQTKSNGGPVALLGGIGIAALFFMKDRRKPVWPVILAVVLVALILVTAVGMIRGAYIWELGGPDNPVRLRAELWRAGLALLPRHGLLGSGAGTFEFAYFPLVGGDARPTKYLHNTFLQIPLELGLLGFIALLTALSLLYRRVSRPEESSEGVNWLRYTLIAAVGSFFISNGIDIVLYFHSLGMFGLFLTGMLLNRERSGNNDEPFELRSRPDRIFAAVACLLAIFMIGRWFIADYYFHQASSRLGTTDILSLQNQLESDKAGEDNQLNPEFAERLERYVRTALIIDSGNYRYHAFYARMLERSPDASELQIRQSWEQAIELCPLMPNLHFSYGLVLIGNGRLLPGAKQVAEAQRLYPSNREYRKARELVEQQLLKTAEGRGGAGQ